MRRLKVPGRIIGRRYHLHIAGYLRDGGDYSLGTEDIPATSKYPAVDKWVKTANLLRTFYGSPWENDPKLQTRITEDVDRDGRGRDGLPVRPPELDLEYLMKLTLIYHLTYAVGIRADGSPTHEKRCWPWGRGSWGGD
ncbi:hypothetical protein ES708_13155 [subsurface metagenome]